mgnify:CR=1 FL=1|jgi:hypothetical protein
MKGGIQGVRLRCAVMARGVNCDAEGTLAASNARPSYLDILPVEVDVGVEVDLMGEKGTECWLDIAGEDADAGRISRICEVPFPPFHRMRFGSAVPNFVIRDCTKVKTSVHDNPAKEVDADLRGGLVRHVV